MNTKSKLLAVALIAAFSAPSAFARNRLTVASVADEAGLSTRQVQMVLGTHTAFAEYRTSFARAREQLVRRIGLERYEELVVAYRAGAIETGES